MLEKFKARLCDEASHWYKMWSTWMAVVWGLVVTVFWNDPTLLPSLLGAMPPETRTLISPVVMGLVSGLPILVRLLKQRKLEKPGG